MRTLIFIGNVALWLATIPAVLFVIFYSRSHWEKNPIGRHTMALSFAIALMLSVSTLATLWPHYPGRVYVRLIAFVFVVITLWWRFINLLVVQRETLRYNRLERWRGKEGQ